jgi:hypothetical protein
MTDTKDDGGPVFPSGLKFTDDYNASHAERGMSLRDWFAGQALAGILANLNHMIGTTTYAQIGKDSYIFADAMLSARKGE